MYFWVLVLSWHLITFWLVVCIVLYKTWLKVCVFNHLAGNFMEAKLAWAAAKHGGGVCILELLLPLQGEACNLMLCSFIFSYEKSSLC